MYQRGLDAKAARSVFFQHLQDIDVYIEDTAEGSEKLYTILLSRVLGDALKIKKFFH